MAQYYQLGQSRLRQAFSPLFATTELIRLIDRVAKCSLLLSIVELEVYASDIYCGHFKGLQTFVYLLFLIISFEKSFTFYKLLSLSKLSKLLLPHLSSSCYILDQWSGDLSIHSFLNKFIKKVKILSIWCKIKINTKNLFSFKKSYFGKRAFKLLYGITTMVIIRICIAVANIWSLIVEILLLIQGIESNPGPSGPGVLSDNLKINMTIRTYNCNGLGNLNKFRRLLAKVSVV